VVKEGVHDFPIITSTNGNHFCMDEFVKVERSAVSHSSRVNIKYKSFQFVQSQDEVATQTIVCKVFKFIKQNYMYVYSM
jgi:hypothetical protein